MESNPLIKVKRTDKVEEFFRLDTMRAKMIAAGNSPEIVAQFLALLQTKYKITTSKGTVYEVLNTSEINPAARP
jgi:hypothetical protein